MKNQLDKNREKHGPWEEYYRNGKLWYIEHYKNGKRHGLSEEYYPSGELFYKGAFKKDNPLGLWHAIFK